MPEDTNVPDQDLTDHLDPEHPFVLDIGGESGHRK
jgi:hypothetical protein